MSNNELTAEKFKEIEEKIKNEMKNRSSLFDDKCYIKQYKTEEELNRERIKLFSDFSLYFLKNYLFFQVI